MNFDNDTLKTLATVASVVNTASQALSFSRSGAAFSDAADAAKRVGKINAGQARAVSQQKAFFARRAGRFAASKALAIAAASGGGAGDPTVIKIIGDLNAQSEFEALSELFTGSSRANALEFRGELDAFNLEARSSLAFGKAITTITSGVSTLRDRFGGSGPPGGKKLTDKIGA